MVRLRVTLLAHSVIVCILAEVPPGVPDLQRLKSTVTDAFGETPNGGIVRIATMNADAIDAIHQFLRYRLTSSDAFLTLTWMAPPSAANRKWCATSS
jgi:hypothetical protein